MYFAILLDRKSSGTIMIGCSEGGTSIEDLAEKYPDKIIKVPVDVREGITDEQANTMVKGLGVTGNKANAAEQIKSLYEMFVKTDCTMVKLWMHARSRVISGKWHSNALEWMSAPRAHPLAAFPCLPSLWKQPSTAPPFYCSPGGGQPPGRG